MSQKSNNPDIEIEEEFEIDINDPSDSGFGEVTIEDITEQSTNKNNNDDTMSVMDEGKHDDSDSDAESDADSDIELEKQKPMDSGSSANPSTKRRTRTFIVEDDIDLEDKKIREEENKKQKEKKEDCDEYDRMWNKYDKELNESIQADLKTYKKQKESVEIEEINDISEQIHNFDEFDSLYEDDLNVEFEDINTEQFRTRDIDEGFDDILDGKNKKIDESRLYSDIKMEDNLMRMKSQYSTRSISKEESIKLMNITKNLYQNIKRVYKIADKLSENIKKLGNKYRIACLEVRSYKLKYERLCLKMKAMMKEKSYLEDVKRRYLQYRREYENQKVELGEKDLHIVQLREEIENIREFNMMDPVKLSELKMKYEKKVNELNLKISDNQTKIEQMMKQSLNTKDYIEKSTAVVGNIMEDRNCLDVMTGGRKAKKIVNKQQKELLRLQKYMDPSYTPIIATTNQQWTTLYDSILGMNCLIEMNDNLGYLNYGIVIPDHIVSSGMSNMYLLFLYQLHTLKVVPDKDCYEISKMLGLPKKINTCKKLKQYFKKDIEKVVKMVRKD